MKTKDIKALLAPKRIEQIEARAKTLGIDDPFGKAAELGGKNVALAAVRVQQLVNLVPSDEDRANYALSAAGKPPTTWADRHPEVSLETSVEGRAPEIAEPSTLDA